MTLMSICQHQKPNLEKKKKPTEKKALFVNQVRGEKLP
jgi:hypothetical protein